MEISDINTEYTLGLPQEEVKEVPAPLSRRAIAYVIDFMIFYFIFFNIFMSIYLGYSNIDPTIVMAADIEKVPEIYIVVIVGAFSSLFIFYFYFILMEKAFGASFGKKFMGIEILPKKMGYGQAAIRSLTKSVLFPLLAIDVISMFFTKEKQRLTEMLANTKVYYEKKLIPIYEYI